MSELMTVGHSTHDIGYFIGLLTAHDVTCVADVRSVPLSRFNPQFNRDALRAALRLAGLDYVFLGHGLGARSDEPSHYDGARVVYERLASGDAFLGALERLEAGLEHYRVALMCSEHDPLTCHRTILVARELAARGHVLGHIDARGRVETHDEAEDRLLHEHGLEADMIDDRATLLSRAYAMRENRIAYRRAPVEAAE